MFAVAAVTAAGWLLLFLVLLVLPPAARPRRGRTRGAGDRAAAVVSLRPGGLTGTVSG